MIKSYLGYAYVFVYGGNRIATTHMWGKFLFLVSISAVTTVRKFALLFVSLDVRDTLSVGLGECSQLGFAFQWSIFCFVIFDSKQLRLL